MDRHNRTTRTWHAPSTAISGKAGRSSPGGLPMRVATAFFALAALGIVAVWAWLGAAVEMPQAVFGPAEKLYCVSYAPFRAGQHPFGPDIPIDPRQIDEDLAQLKQITDCVRTYSVDHGLD